ncbi:Uncharacterized protein APZ42_034148 [Daphnia magna]|uniref:Uncharacterized protein n=1 Tax=Daphnia magna TaxID=35525 RepID=A0A164KGY7_9CRUS|nr:Uncharacterized protein APZ42_034148 [Daphnia magna]
MRLFYVRTKGRQLLDMNAVGFRLTLQSLPLASVLPAVLDCRGLGQLFRRHVGSKTKEEHVYIYKRKEIRHCFDSPFDMIKLHTFTFWKKREPQGFFVGEQNGSPYISGHFFFKTPVTESIIIELGCAVEKKKLR